MRNQDADDDTGYCLADLPETAWTRRAGRPLEIDDAWLRDARARLQRAALEAWFTDRYCDPAEETPYDGREGGYLYIHGGPFDPAEELFDRFGGVVDDPVIQDVVDALYAQVGDEWAPLRRHEDAFDVEVHAAGEPFANLSRRLAEARLVLGLKGDAQAERLVVHWAYGGLITALETYLWETLVFWVDTDDTVLQRLVTGFEEFRARKLTLGDVFHRMAGLRSEVRGHLQAFIWHRWSDVARLYVAAFNIEPPSFAELEAPLRIRHDIIHRNSQTKDGEPVVVTADDVEALAATIGRFAIALAMALPDPPSDFDASSPIADGFA